VASKLSILMGIGRKIAFFGPKKAKNTPKINKINKNQ
jgi:hypothetical protein